MHASESLFGYKILKQTFLSRINGIAQTAVEKICILSQHSKCAPIHVQPPSHTTIDVYLLSCYRIILSWSVTQCRCKLTKTKLLERVGAYASVRIFDPCKVVSFES